MPPAAAKEDALRNALRLTLGLAVSARVPLVRDARAPTGTPSAACSPRRACPGWSACRVLGVLAISLRAQRWRLLLRPVATCRSAPAFSATAIGFAATSVLPLRLGEVVRPALLARRVGFGVSPALSSVVLERLFDMLFVILLLPRAVAASTRCRPTCGGAALAARRRGGRAASCVLLLVQRNRARAERLLDARAARGCRPRVGAGVAAARRRRSSTRSVRSSRRASSRGVLGYSALLWAANALPFLFALLALGIDVPLVPASLASIVIVAAFVFLPQAPGFVGTWQAGCVLALELFGVPKDLAVGYSLLTWIVQMVVNVGLGGVFVAREDLSLRQLVRDGRRRPAGRRRDGREPRGTAASWSA